MYSCTDCDVQIHRLWCTGTQWHLFAFGALIDNAQKISVNARGSDGCAGTRALDYQRLRHVALWQLTEEVSFVYLHVKGVSLVCKVL